MTRKKKISTAVRKAPSSQRPSRWEAGRDSDTLPLGQYLIRRLYDLGARHIFGIPGDYVLGFYKLLENSPLELVGNTTELAAGYAADAYARIRGIGVACVTYGVGGFSIVNAVACAYAEESPVVVISGAPGLRERGPHQYLHHVVRSFETQREVFRHLTVASAALEDPLTAFREIDRVLFACIRYKRPVYIELPRDVIEATPLYKHCPFPEKPRSDPQALEEAVAEALAMLRQSSRPILLAGVEVHRFGLQDLVVQLAEKAQIPITSTLLGKSAIKESHPLYVGVYEAALGRPEVTKFVEDSDCVLALGTYLTDMEMGIYTQKFDESRIILATSESVRIRFHHYQGILLEDFLRALCEQDLPQYDRSLPEARDPIYAPWEAKPDTPITIRRLFQKINSILDDNMVVIADIGDSLFAASDLTIHQKTEFISPAYYTSMGFAVPAAIGVQCANRKLRPLVLVGDGAFQMTGMELSTAVRLGFDPIVVVINNGGYQTERFIMEGKFNDILDWNYHRLPDLLGSGWGFEVKTETDLEKALRAALSNRDTFSLLNVRIPPDDVSPALRRLGRRLQRRV
ncbi:Indole-3-pyruvate decarboxylase [bacterium HR36]|nr:Indole-3-pyruvate decarboxylase [bacterium HR36]